MSVRPWNSGVTSSPPEPPVTSFSDTMTMRSTSENATVNSARYGPRMRRQTKPMPLPTMAHISTPATMPSGIGMPNVITSRPEV